MRRIALFLFLLGACLSLQAQNEITIEGYLIDEETNLPVPYVNIGFIDKAIGTVSDESGRFRLTYNYDKINANDVLQISSLGYITIKLKGLEFIAKISKNNTIYMTPESYALDEVVLSNLKRKERRVGHSRLDDKTIGYWLNKEALGGEIATKVNITKRNSKLLDLKLHIKRNNSGNIKIRVNIYDYENGLPGKNLLKENIFHTISKTYGEEIINLEPYDIYVHNDIVVSIEMIKVYGAYVDFEVAGAISKGRSFTRHLSQDTWKDYQDKSVAFSLNTSFPTDRKADEKTVREIPGKITLYWDTSLTMEQRNLEDEIELLNRYLKKIKNVDVELIKFSTFAAPPTIYTIKNGNTDALVKALRDSHYEGATSYTGIVEENTFGADAILVFTDGNEDLVPLNQKAYVPAFYINAMDGPANFKLHKAASYADGHYIDLNKITSKKALELMLAEITDETIYEEDNNLSIGNIYGKITLDSLIIQGASIKVKNTLREAISDANGRYSIQAEEGDMLEISALGMQTKVVQVPGYRTLDINLQPDGEMLDEVILKARARQKETVVTPFGERNADAVAYSYQEITADEINSSHQTYDQVIAKLPGVLIEGIGDRKRYRFPVNMAASVELDASPIIVIDDVIYFQSDGLENLPPIDFQTVVSVRAIKSVIGTNRYGSAGAYGAIEIRTEATAERPGEKQEPKASALVKGNDYNGEDIMWLEKQKTIPTYIKQLSTATTYKEALQIYKQQKRNKNIRTIPFYMDVSDYFRQWDKDFAFRILTNIASEAKDNAKALKTLAYKLEALGKNKDAQHVYERIATLRPKDAQSYRDLALIYETNGHYEKAMTLYKQMLSNSIEGVDFSGMDQVIANELSHLLAHHRSKVDTEGIPSDYLTAKFKFDKRIVFEWNDPKTEFELQFVNPEKKFFKWSHTKFENAERMLDEIKKGYATEVYILDDAKAGSWLINIEALKEDVSANPTYIKYIIYRNYGLANETREIKVVNLNDCIPKVTFDSLEIN